MSKAIRLAILGQKAAKSALIKSQILMPSTAASCAIQQQRNKSYYGEPKLFKELTEVLLSVEDPDGCKWKMPPSNSTKIKLIIEKKKKFNNFLLIILKSV